MANPAQVSSDADQTHLEKELAFYGSYHSNVVNKLIHFCFIPQIWWSWLIIAAHVVLPDLPTAEVYGVQVHAGSLATAFMLVFQAYYMYLSPFVGATYIPVMVLEFLSAQYIAEKVPAWLPWQTAFGPTPSALPFATFVFFNAWVWQFVGHFKFEGRAPALFDNLTQALVTAPLFVHIEALFGVFNWNPTLHKRINNAISKRIVAMNKAKREGGKKTN